MSEAVPTGPGHVVTASPAKSTRAEQRAESIERIIEATIEAFAELGYAGASIKTIAQRAGVSRSLLHYHFKSKEDLVMRAIRHMAKTITDELSVRTGGLEPSLSRLVATADDVFELFVSDPVRAGFVLELFATANHNPQLQSSFNQFRREIRQLIHEIIVAGVGDESARPAGIPIWRMVMVVETWMLGLSIQSAMVADPGEIRQVYDDLIGIMTGLIRATVPDLP